MLACASLLLGARTIVDLTLGPGALTPLVITIPPTAMILITALMTLSSSLVSFFCCYTMLRRLRQRTEILENSMKEATAVAQMIVNFDLDGVPKACGCGDAVDLMVQVAEKLKLYRPYLPAHLFASAGDEPDLDGFETISAPPASIGGSCSRAALQLPARPSPRPPTPDQMLTTRYQQSGVHRSLSARDGTMLRVRISQIEQAETSLGSVSYGTIEGVVDMFARLVTNAAKETKGMLHTIAHDHCLILWNVLPRCAMHVVHGLRAGVMIRDGFKKKCEEQKLEGLTVTMGLWAGAFVSGTMSMADVISHACLGQGPEQVVALQEYAAVFRRSIICNDRVFEMTKAAPRHRLVAVDALSFDGNGRGEIVYECVSELEPDADEWMYQVHANRSVLTEDSQLRKLLQQVQDGKIADLTVFDAEVLGLRESDDPIVSQVACGLWTIARHHLIGGRYHRSLQSIWPQEPYYGADGPRRTLWPPQLLGDG